MDLFINQPYQIAPIEQHQDRSFAELVSISDTITNRGVAPKTKKNYTATFKLARPRSSLPVLARSKSSPNSYSFAWCHCSTSLAHWHQARKTFSTVEIVLSTDCITASMVKGRAERLASRPTRLWLGEQSHNLCGIREIAQKESARQTSQAGWSDWCGPL